MISLRRGAIAAVSLMAVLAVPVAANAHRQWLLPSATVLSGNDPWITVDAAVSNDLFYFDHVPMRLEGITVFAPDGSKGEIKNGATGKYRSTFDVQLDKPGTYNVANVSDGLMASYKLNGEAKRWRGPLADLATAIPKDATEVKLTQSQRRLEIFATRGSPTKEVLKVTGQGLELEPVTHPNDLVSGEARAEGRRRLRGLGVARSWGTGSPICRITGISHGVPGTGTDATVLPWPRARTGAEPGWRSAFSTGAP